jgi:phosphorylcholine metabolism protein LicD
MGITKICNFLSYWIIYIGLPAVSLYLNIQQTPFLAFQRKEAVGIEKVADTLLMPVHYIIAGKSSSKNEIESDYEISYRFDYKNHLSRNSVLSVIAFPISYTAGYFCKTLSLIDPTVRKEYKKISRFLRSTKTKSLNDLYLAKGIELHPWETLPIQSSQGYMREEMDSVLSEDDLLLFQNIVSIFKKHKITFWLDCGTCLGAYRYGGVIPWDTDFDMAVLEPDFTNIMHALQELDPKKFEVQDWSSRCVPNTYTRVYVKNTRNHIDIYHFAINEKEKMLEYILSNEHSDFMPEFWKIRERRFKVATPIKDVFPLKKMVFDGVEVTVPNRIVSYLKARYGEDLRPAKIYNPEKGTYERDEDHPYWQRAHAH